jgi:hypothetical protein
MSGRLYVVIHKVKGNTGMTNVRTLIALPKSEQALDKLRGSMWSEK